MKVSLKLQDDNHHHPAAPPVLLRAKIPITVFNLPFLSHFSTTPTTHPSHLALSLSTNFPSFPSLKFSYAAASSAAPFTLTLKSGAGLFGSPNNSPLVISAQFSFNPSNPCNPNPTFSLFLKPQLGSFSLRKSTSSHPAPESAAAGEPSSPVDSNPDPNSFAFVPLEAVKGEDSDGKLKGSVLKGTRLAAATRMPVTKRVALDFRWWVNLAEDQMPVLRINKIGIHRIEEDSAKKSEEKEAKSRELESVKSMCYWMKKEMDVLTRELEEMRRNRSGGAAAAAPVAGGYGVGNAGKKAMISPSTKSSREEKGNGGGSVNANGKKEVKKNGNVAIDVENELQRAIMAASSSSSS